MSEPFGFGEELRRRISCGEQFGSAELQGIEFRSVPVGLTGLEPLDITDHVEFDRGRRRRSKKLHK